MQIIRVTELRDGEGRAVPFIPAAEGGYIRTAKRDAALTAICEVSYPELEAETDEPRLPAYAHAALADYICYRHLSSGSLAKQQRAQFFLHSFTRQMRAIQPAGRGSVASYANLYEATACRPRG